MGSSQSVTEVSVIAEGEEPGPFATRRHPSCKSGVVQNSPDMQTMQKFTLNFFEKYSERLYVGQRTLLDPVKEEYDNEFHFITYKEGFARCKDFGCGLFKMGYNVGKTLGVYAANSAEWVHAIDASSLFGFVIVSLYDSLGPDSLHYLLGHSKMEAVLVQQKNLDKLMKILSKDIFNVKNIIVIGEQPSKNYGIEGLEITTFDKVCELGKKNPIELPEIDPQTPHFICYSSGTTGNPKGVIISHATSVSNTLSAADMINVGDGATHLSYLPLAHVFERAAESVTAYYGGKMGFISGGVKNIKADLAVLRPTFMVAVPRVINRFYDGIMDNLKKSAVKKAVFWGAWYAKRFCIQHYLPTGILDKIVFEQIKKLLGGRVSMFVVGGAAMDPKVQEVFQFATGVPVRTGYGLTEAGSGNICSPPDIHFVKCGSIGGPLKNVEVRLEPIEDYDDPLCGQIIIGGPCVSSGYLYDEKSTEELFTDKTHKWIKTGDVGKWDEDGYMIVVDRMRSIFKLSQGEYVAAESLSQIYDKVPIIEQSFIYGDSTRSYLVAIIVPDKKEVSKFLGKDRVTKEEFAEACANNDDLKKKILADLRVASDENKLFGYQRIMKVALEPEAWTVENEYQTPTFKLKRKKLENRYKDVIEQLYKD
jgi:long-chain acyl-CoA synthetase